MKVSKHVEQLLRQGRKPKELVQLGFPKSVVTRVRRQLREEKAASQKKETTGTPQTESQIQTAPESPDKNATIWQKVQSMANDLQRIDVLIQALSEVTTVIAAARELGTYRLETCQHQEGGLCSWQAWDSQDEVPQGIGEPVRVGDDKTVWCIKPSPLYCAMCTTTLEDRIDDVESKASESPLYGAKYRTICNTCGSKGFIAAAVKCTKCGHETWWGWWPKKE